MPDTSIPPSFPFIIWCCQRTGSNSLMDSLCAVSGHMPAPPEPFDTGITEDRHFSHIVKMEPGERDQAIALICSRRFLIRHCYENLPDDFNRALLEIATRAGYRHIHLRRNDEVARLVSKGIAEQHGTWIPSDWTEARYEAWRIAGRPLPPLDIEALKQYHERCRSRWMALSGMQHLSVASEDLFSDPERLLSRVAAYLDIPQASVPAMVSNIRGGQGTPSIWNLIPNIDELRKVVIEK